jgi:rhamnosyltransferase
MRLLAIVILYYPDEKVRTNIESYIQYVDKLIVWDNTPGGNSTMRLPESRKISLEGTGKNMGIGKPLNVAVDYALKNHYSHLLTMDQDSSFATDKFLEYIEIIKANTESDICLFSPGGQSAKGKLAHSIVDINATITSGSVYRTELFDEVGLFREDFFIDAIDTEFCLRIKRHHYRIVWVMDVLMQHTLGYKLKKDFLGGRFSIGSLNYSPMRTYYIVRNHLAVRFMYPEYKNIRYIVKLFVVKRFFAIIFIEQDKLPKLKAMFRGLFAALTKKMNPY